MSRDTRSELRSSFRHQVRARIGLVAAGLGLEWMGGAESSDPEEACLFGSPSHRLRVTLGEGHVATVVSTWSRVGRRRLRRRRPEELGLTVLAEALDLPVPHPRPVRGAEELEHELDRLADWLQAHGDELESAGDADWRRAFDIVKRRTDRKRRVLRDPEASARIDRHRRQAEAARRRNDPAALVDAYEAIEEWLLPDERNELEAARWELGR